MVVMVTLTLIRLGFVFKKWASTFFLDKSQEISYHGVELENNSV